MIDTKINDDQTNESNEFEQAVKQYRASLRKTADKQEAGDNGNDPMGFETEFEIQGTTREAMDQTIDLILKMGFTIKECRKAYKDSDLRDEGIVKLLESGCGLVMGRIEEHEGRFYHEEWDGLRWMIVTECRDLSRKEDKEFFSAMKLNPEIEVKVIVLID
jgi:hypothetical protein